MLNEKLPVALEFQGIELRHQNAILSYITEYIMEPIKKRVLIFVPSISGHINPTIKLANYLSGMGFDVIYLCDKSIFEKPYLKDFNKISFSFSFFAPYKLLVNRKLCLSDYWEGFLLTLTGSYFREALDQLEQLEAKLNDLQPDVLFIDVFYSHIYVLLKEKDFQVIFLQTMFSTYYGKNIPPMQSSIIPNSSYYSHIRIFMTWKYLILYYRIRGIIGNLLRMGPDTLVRQISKKRNIQIDDFSNKLMKSFHLGILGHEIVLAPEELDWPRGKKISFQTYLGPSVNLSRIEEVGHDFLVKWEIILDQKRYNSDLKIIYCCLGSIAKIHISDKWIKRFYNLIGEVVSRQRDWLLIISTGGLDTDLMTRSFPNCYVFKWVPQLDVLSHSDVFVTHAGLNSLMEGVLSKVPLICFPLSRKWDQMGNASRIVFKQLGLRGNIKRVSFNKLSSMIYQVLHTTTYKENVLNISLMLESRYTDVSTISKLEKILSS